MHRINSLLFLLLLVCFLPTAKAQVGQSPYTVQGIGSLHSMATGRNLGMGGIGIGNSHYLYLNNLNPAMLARNSFYTTFEVGMNLESRSFDTGEQQDVASSGGLDYLALAFPLIYDKWSMNVGLSPYSIVNYSTVTSRPITGTTSISHMTFKGDGGTTQAYAATGFKLFKGLSAGVRASYIFGSINEEIVNSLELANSTTTSFASRYYNQTSFSDFLFTGGLAYRRELSSSKQNYLMAGLTYDMEANLNAERFSRLERAYPTSSMANSIDTLAYGLSGNYFLPASIGTGISYERLYRYTIGADFKWQNWEDYRGFEGAEGGLGQSYRAAFGAEWIPDYASAQPGTYYKRMTYRMGLQYEKTPFMVNDERVDDFGITFGLTMPVANASSIHTSFLIGQRGNVDNGLIRERYFRFSLGVTFNDRWFQRVKYD